MPRWRSRCPGEGDPVLFFPGGRYLSRRSATAAAPDIPQLHRQSQVKGPDLTAARATSSSPWILSRKTAATASRAETLLHAQTGEDGKRKNRKVPRTHADEEGDVFCGSRPTVNVPAAGIPSGGALFRFQV